MITKTLESNVRKTIAGHMSFLEDELNEIIINFLKGQDILKNGLSPEDRSKLILIAREEFFKG